VSIGRLRVVRSRKLTCGGDAPDVDGGVCGAYALGQLTGSGDFARHPVPARAPALTPLKAHTRKTSLRPLDGF
jgi:hypothetical protein